MLKMALSIFALTFLFTCAFQIIGRFLINYDVKNNFIRILIFNFIPIYKVMISEKLEVEELSFAKRIKPNFKRINLSNRFVGRVVEIRHSEKKYTLTVTPNDPTSFIRQVHYAQTIIKKS